jgi:Na+-driven multidrug efflux pump
LYIRKKVPVLRLTRADFRQSFREIVEPLRVALPLGFQMSIIAIGTMAVQFAVNGLGASMTAAYTAAMRIENIAIMPLSSFGVAMVTFVAQNRGAREWARIRTGVFRMAVVAGAVGTVLGTGLIFFGRSLSVLFVSAAETHVVDASASVLIVSGLFQIVIAVMFILRSSVQGMGVAWVPAFSGVLELAARVLVAFAFVAPFGIKGLAFAGPLAWTFALVPAALEWKRQHRKLQAWEEGDAMLRQHGSEGDNASADDGVDVILESPHRGAASPSSITSEHEASHDDLVGVPA